MSEGKIFICASCHTANRKQAQYCRGCGKPLLISKGSEPDDLAVEVRCAKCGQDVPLGIFCDQCGEKLPSEGKVGGER